MITTHLFEHLSRPIAFMTLQGKITYLNLKARQQLGKIEDVKVQHLQDILELEEIICELDAIFHQLGKMTTGEHKTWTLTRSNGHPMILSFIKSETFIVLEWIEEANEPLKLDLFDYLIEDAREKMIFYKDKDLIYRYANQAYVRLFKMGKDWNLIGLTDEDLLHRGIISPVDYHQCVLGDEEAYKKGQYLDVEFMEGGYYQIFKTPIKGGILGVVKDVTTEIMGQQELEHDAITMLQNRKALLKVLNAIPKDTTYYAVGILIDNLGEVARNKGVTYAHQCLKQVAYFVKEYPDILFFYLDGIGFIGLLDKLRGDLESFRQSLEAEILNRNFPEELKISTIADTLDDYSDRILALLKS